MEFSRQEQCSGLHSLVQGLFLTQISNLSLLHCIGVRQYMYGARKILKYAGDLHFLIMFFSLPTALMQHLATQASYWVISKIKPFIFQSFLHLYKIT